MFHQNPFAGSIAAETFGDIGFRLVERIEFRSVGETFPIEALQFLLVLAGPEGRAGTDKNGRVEVVVFREKFKMRHSRSRENINFRPVLRIVSGIHVVGGSDLLLIGNAADSVRLSPALFKAGISSPARIAMIAITIRSSISEKYRILRRWNMRMSDALCFIVLSAFRFSLPFVFSFQIRWISETGNARFISHIFLFPPFFLFIIRAI